MSVEVGSKAPDFTLKTKTSDGLRDVTLSDNFGKKQTVLLFVPLAFTPVCTKQFCTATDEYEQYSALDAEVWGISLDSPFTLEVWARTSNMNIPLLADMNKEVMTTYGVLDKEYFDLGGVARRSAFVVNKDGKVTYRWIASDQGEFPPFDSIKEALKQEIPAEKH